MSTKSKLIIDGPPVIETADFGEIKIGISWKYN